MTSDKELKKRDAIATCKQIISMDKYEVLGHQTTNSFPYTEGLEIPKGVKTMLVIYLK
jgi:hypothetical protein